MSNDPPIAVCIVGFRNVQDILQCLASLGASTYRAFEVVICENGGRDAAAALRERLPGSLAGGQPVRMIEGVGNPGFAAGVNRCIAGSPAAEAWWILNPDTLPKPGALAALVRRWRQGDVDAVGSTICYVDGVVQTRGGKWKPWLARVESIGWGDPPNKAVDPAEVEGQISFIAGASMFIGRRFLEKVGPMREDYFLYGEEVEWFLRSRRTGMKLGFAPDSIVIHQQGTTTGSGGDVGERPKLPVYMDERNRINVVRDTSPLHLPVAIIGAFALLFLRFARRGAWHQLRYALAGWVAGVRGLRGKPDWFSD